MWWSDEEEFEIGPEMGLVLDADCGSQAEGDVGLGLPSSWGRGNFLGIPCGAVAVPLLGRPMRWYVLRGGGCGCDGVADLRATLSSGAQRGSGM